MSGLNGDNTVSGYTDVPYGKYNVEREPTILGRPDYTNKKTTLHNNINENILLESLCQNKVFIDTSIKDYSLEPDLFKFSVNFSSGNISFVDETVVIEDTENFSFKRNTEGNSNIHIEKNFRNVKNVSIDALIMPSVIEFKTNKDNLYEPVHKSKISYKYIVLKIKELYNGRCFSNNNNIGSESFIMKLDDDLCSNNNIWIPINCNIFYPDSQLKNIDKLTVEICDNKGDLLVTKLDGKPFDFFKEYRNLIKEIKSLQANKNDICFDSSTSTSSTSTDSTSTDNSDNICSCNKCKISSLMSKLVSLRRITSYLSPELHMTFTTLESQINTLPTYRY